MGHKVNPDIFRLGVSKTWTFQLRTNKNFIKNLFLFKFLRNLFMNYTIPVFDFKRRRNQKVNDKLILRGEEQLVASPFVKNNILFSHVYFGEIKDKIFIESFFIDVAIKQQRRKKEKIKRNYFFDITEYKPWTPLFYRSSVIGRLKKLKIKSKSKLRKVFCHRIFKVIGKRSKLFKVKPLNRISKDFYKFLKNYNPKFNLKLYKYLNPNYWFFLKRSKKKKHFLLRIFKKKKISKKNLSKKDQYYLAKTNNIIKRKIQKRRILGFIKSMNFMRTLFFVRQKYLRLKRRVINKAVSRYFPKFKLRHYTRVRKSYINRLKVRGYKKIFLPKLLNLISRNYQASLEFASVKKSLPKNPLYVFDIAFANEKHYTFYKNYQNIKTLKYFIRAAKFVQYYSTKKKIFFSQNLICLLMNFFGMSNTTVLTKKMYLLLQSMLFYTLTFSFYNFINFKKTFFFRFCFFKGVSKTVYRSLIELISIKKLSFCVVGQNKFRFNSSLVLNYILIKLGQYFSIHEIVNPLSYYIKGLTSIAGYKILIRGRLTRKERAAVMVRSGKRMPLSTIKANIDYSAGFKIMKFGLVGIKVYLLLKPSNLINLYRFKYDFDAKVS